MEPIYPKRIYTRPLRNVNRRPSVGKAHPSAESDADSSGADVVFKPIYTHERRSGRDRRDGRPVSRKYLDMRSGRDRRRCNKLDIKV